MNQPSTPRAVFERLLQGISDGAWSEIADLYAEDAVVDIPFATPPVHIEGRAEIHRHFLRGADLPLTLTARNVVVHETTDPEVVIAEFDYEIQGVRAARSANVQVLRVRDGKIVATRDYHDHAAIAGSLVA